MPIPTYFNSFVENLPEKVHNLQSDTLRVMLTNTLPVVTNTVRANITEIAAGNGYAAGGLQAVQSSSTQTGGTYRLVLNDVVFTASGGSIGPLRYVVLYNDSATNDELVFWVDYGESFSIPNGETFTVRFDAINGLLTLAVIP